MKWSSIKIEATVVKVDREADFVVKLRLHSYIHGQLDTTRLTTC